MDGLLHYDAPQTSRDNKQSRLNGRCSRNHDRCIHGCGACAEAFWTRRQHRLPHRCAVVGGYPRLLICAVRSSGDCGWAPDPLWLPSASNCLQHSGTAGILCPLSHLLTNGLAANDHQRYIQLCRRMRRVSGTRAPVSVASVGHGCNVPREKHEFSKETGALVLSTFISWSSYSRERPSKSMNATYSMDTIQEGIDNMDKSRNNSTWSSSSDLATVLRQKC
jgi:hypothetical protein